MASQSGASPRLSIVIPAADTEALEETLVSVLENRPADCEIIAALAVPYADPWNIGEEVRFMQAPPGATLVDCVNLGAATASGEVVHILAAGWRATEGWAEAATARFADPAVAAVVPLAVAADDRSRVVAAGVRRTSGGRSVTVGPARGGERIAAGEAFRCEGRDPAAPLVEAGFWRADALGSGFAKACGDRLAAADMAALLTCSGETVVVESSCRVVAGPGVRPASSFLEGMRAERLFWRSLAAEPLLAGLVSHAIEIARHAVATAPLGTLPMLAGRLATLMQFGSCLSRTRQLEAAKSRAADRARQAAADPAERTIRIDSGHALPGRPRRPDIEPGRESPLRRSA